jgi:ankyrin repeat protein
MTFSVTCSIAGALLLFPSLAFALDHDQAQSLGNSLRVAAQEGRFPVVLRLLDQGADPDAISEWGVSALMLAARYNEPQVSRVLLERGANPNLRDHLDDTALTYSAKQCSPSVAQTILKNSETNVNWINSEGQNALIIAAKEGCVPIALALIALPRTRLGVRDVYGHTALDYADEQATVETGGPHSIVAAALRHALSPSAPTVSGTPPPL